MVGIYRPKSDQVGALQWHGSLDEEMRKFLSGHEWEVTSTRRLYIAGHGLAWPGDYIVKSEDGNLYVMNGDGFHKAYGCVEEENEVNQPAYKSIPYSEDVGHAAFEDFKNEFHSQMGKGARKYGTSLQTFNNRSMFKDCLQELVDAVNYLEGLQMQYMELRKASWDVVEHEHGFYIDRLESLLTAGKVDDKDAS